MIFALLFPSLFILYLISIYLGEMETETQQSIFYFIIKEIRRQDMNEISTGLQYWFLLSCVLLFHLQPSFSSFKTLAKYKVQINKEEKDIRLKREGHAKKSVKEKACGVFTIFIFLFSFSFNYISVQLYLFQTN